MEDAEIDSQVTDSWTVGVPPTSPVVEETLKRTSRVLSESALSPRVSYNDSDSALEENKEDRCSSDGGSEDSPSKFETSPSKIIFKGFKKRILAQAQENQVGIVRRNSHDSFLRGTREKRGDGKRGKITEYAQYLGLQPAASNPKQTKCTKCNTNNSPTNNSCPQSMLKPQQCTCPPGSTAGLSSPGTSDSSTLPPISSPQSSSAPSAANNFRITRKVYLCAACGTYFENWNLFLHMREIHKRHICLFCLGMFGQAERLSYHLAKKHSVPETSFTSVEDFYNVFKGSCYLICCTCEKVFSETDNFYNHFCSPVQKSRTTAANEVCSLCRQSGTHSSTCSLAESRETGQNATGIPGIQGNIGNTNKESSGVRSKRMLKNNRLKRSEESLLMSYQQKLSEMYARKMNMKSREGNRENASSGDESAPSVTSESLETATTTIPSVLTENEASKSSRDTVSETIMEVSKCTDDFRVSKGFCDEEIVEINSKADSKNESSPCPSPSASPSRSPSPLRRQSDASLYDSVAETIMEVSRCSNDSQQDNTSAEEDDEEENSRGGDARRESRDTGSEADVLVMDDVADLDNDAESANGKEDYDDRLKNVKNERRKTDEETNENEPNEASDSEDECSSNQSENASPSRLNSTGDTEIGSSPEKESQTTSVSVTTVNATDRSLVIKICTNRNAQFSVTSANGTNYGENHDTSRESEENNNGEDSASDKHSNHSGRTSPNSFHGDEDDDEEQSDSDTGKLAVVDEEKQENPAATAENENPGDEEKKEQEESPEVGKNETPQIAIEHDENHDEINVENITSAASEAPQEDAKPPETEKPMEESDGIVLAAEDVPSIDLNVEGLLESMEIEDLLKRCISAASGYCVYCNHARHIAVNGKQLSLHVLAEHRFQPQHPAIIINRDQFTARIKKSIDEVETLFFNLNTFNSERGTYEVQNPRVFECFHCRFHSLIHKDIYLHNRKMHQKTILICIMCKSTFYSYSELLCHLCPGVYSPNINVTYRCCLCTVSNLPSAFRLMVHLRKRHHSCDVCLESTGNQQRLSNHVWKHKLHHLCYRCGIAYRNKPDITKHLFWKHGTESVLCKKCLQKKWPHVYHFCIPPTAFVCEECTSTFSRAVALKVHKRLHSGDRPYGCNECPERFISKKLLAKHEMSHREPEKLPEVASREKTPVKEMEEPQEATETTSAPSNVAEPEVNENTANETKEPKEIVKKVVDVYDLPPLNLSSESDSESEEEKPSETAAKSLKDDETKQEEIKSQETKKEEANSTANADVATNNDVLDSTLDPDVNEEVKEEEAQIMDGIWDNFKSYAASLEKPSLDEPTIAEKEEEARMKFLCEVILADHDYCVVSTEKIDAEELKEDAKIEDNCGTMEGEHDYGHKPKSPSTESVVLNCDSDTNVKKKKEKSPKKRKQNGSTSSSDSSSDSDSSSCSCGTNCSCSSSSSGSSSSSSSSSDSDSSASESSPKKSSSARKERKEEKKKEAAAAATAAAAAEAVKNEVKVEEVEENPPENPVFEETPQQNEEANQSIEICEPPRSPQLIFRESDLDTDETETDEDFYDEHPQQLANKLLAEKRNQLMLLAAVAPASNESPAAAGATSTANNLNNGQIDVDTTRTNSIPTEDTNEEARNSNARGQTRKKVKTKKRKKAERTKSNRVATPTVESIKLNIPKSFYQKKQPGFNSATPAIITVLPSRSSTPNLQNSQPEIPAFTQDANKTNLRLSVGGSGSETENKRSSKRKRVPKRFYDDSSDEEAERQQQQQQQQQLQYNQPNFKWRKVDNPNFVPTISIKTQPTPSVNFPTKNVTLRLSGFDQPLERIVPMNTVNAAASATESEEAADSSSAESSEAEVNVASQASQPIIQQPRPTILPPNPSIIPTNSTGGPERSVNLYCYCQCPYDEVSEMIACDGDDCRIEWFHFECVGIMVPPKGKWYCPDCRKKDASLPSNEDYFD